MEVPLFDRVDTERILIGGVKVSTLNIRLGLFMPVTKTRKKKKKKESVCVCERKERARSPLGMRRIRSAGTQTKNKTFSLFSFRFQPPRTLYTCSRVDILISRPATHCVKSKMERWWRRWCHQLLCTSCCQNLVLIMFWRTGITNQGLYAP